MAIWDIDADRAEAVASQIATDYGIATCADAVLETVNEDWIIQAVYCDNLENAQKNFCPTVDPKMKGDGLPSPVWENKETEACMATAFSPSSP